MIPSFLSANRSAATHWCQDVAKKRKGKEPLIPPETNEILPPVDYFAEFRKKDIDPETERKFKEYIFGKRFCDIVDGK